MGIAPRAQASSRLFPTPAPCDPSRGARHAHPRLTSGSFDPLRRRASRALPHTATPQQQPPATPVSAQPGLNADLPGATITRVLFAGVQPNTALRSTLSRRPPLPGSQLAAFLWIIAALLTVFTAARRWVIGRTRSCTQCRGYSIQPCALCETSGFIRWAGKWDHVEPCPRCMGRRYIKCTSCGGLHVRPLFAHVSRNAGVQAAMTGNTGVLGNMVD